MTTLLPVGRTAILVPDLGVGADSVRVSAWLVDVGQTVVAGDRVVELLMPGITFDIAAERTGELLAISRHVDEIVSAGEILGWIATSD